MARGKYAVRATGRRTLAEAEDRGDAAERRVSALEKEAAQAREESGAAVRQLRSALADAQTDRDAATAPALKEAEGTIAVLRIDLKAARAESQTLYAKWQVVAARLVKGLQGIGMSYQEAGEFFLHVMGAPGVTVVDNRPGNDARLGPDGYRAVQRARGDRGNLDLREDMAATFIGECERCEGAPPAGFLCTACGSIGDSGEATAERDPADGKPVPESPLTCE